MPRMDPRGRRGLAAAVFVLALGARAYFLWAGRDSPFHAFPIVDAKEYHLWALSIRDGHGLLALTARHSPLYPLLLAALYRLFGVTPWPVYALQAVLGAATAALCFLAAGNMTRRPAAAAAGLVAALGWPFVYFTGSLLPQVLEMFLVALALWALSGAQAPSWRRAGAAGLALGLACGLRPQLLPAAGLLALSLRWAWRGGSWRSAGACGAGLLVLSLSWGLYLGARGRPTLVQAGTGLNLYVGNHAGASGTAADFPGLDYIVMLRQGLRHARGGLTQDRYYLGQVGSWLRSDPRGAARLALRRLGLTLARVEIPAGEAQPWLADGSFPLLRRWDFGVLLALGLPGGLLAAWRGHGPAKAFLVLFASGLAALAIGPAAARYRAPLLPVLAIGAGLTAAYCADAFAGRRSREAAALAAAVLALVLAGARLDGLTAVAPSRNLGIALSLQGRGGGDRAPQARRLLEDWVSGHPRDWEAAWHLGLTQAYLKDWPAAERSFVAVARARGADWPALHGFVAWLRAVQGDLPGARQAARESYEADPRSLESCLRAVLYSRLRDPAYPAARELCRCPLDQSGRDLASGAFESFAAELRGTQGSMDLQAALPYLEASFWRSLDVDYPARELGELFTRKRWPKYELSCRVGPP